MPESGDVSDWWRTKIIEMQPRKINLRGHPVQDLIGNQSFAELIWLMVIGTPISGPRANLF